MQKNFTLSKLVFNQLINIVNFNLFKYRFMIKHFQIPFYFLILFFLLFHFKTLQKANLSVNICGNKFIKISALVII